MDGQRCSSSSSCCDEHRKEERAAKVFQRSKGDASEAMKGNLDHAPIILRVDASK
ncbi:MAG: hypothetical protein AB1351_13140 [Thermoproteota archaeon]